MSNYGDGVYQMDRALGYLIKQTQYAQRKWNLTNEALCIVLERLKDAERDGIHGTLRTWKAILPTDKDAEK